MTPEQLAKSGSEHAHQRALFAAVNKLILDNQPKELDVVGTTNTNLFADTKNSKIADKLKWLHAIPNGGERHAAVAGKMKAEGTKRGVFDLFLPVPTYFTNPQTQKVCSKYYGLYIEMKEPGRRNHKNGGLSDEQVEFGKFVRAQGYATFVAYTWEEAFKAIMGYLGVPT